MAKLVHNHVIQSTASMAYYISEEDAKDYFDRRRKKMLIVGITAAIFLGVMVCCYW